MTEKSFYWADIPTGDGSLSTYDDDEFSDIWRILFMDNRATMGYIQNYLNELAVTNPSGSTIRVATGAALVDGKFYESDANVDNSINTPLGLVRVDRIVLRKSWAAQTIRVTIITGSEGSGPPAIVQIDGTTWDVPLAQASITTGGAITMTDERVICTTPLSTNVGGAMREIETIIGDGAISVIDFQNIPSTYKHLIIMGTVRMSGAILEATLEARFNADAGNNYNEQSLTGDNATPNASSATAQAQGQVGESPAASATSSHVGLINIFIPNYKETTFYKNILSSFSNIPNNTVADFSAGQWAVIWLNTAAITRIQLLSTTGSAGNFTTKTKVTLYGIL